MARDRAELVSEHLVAELDLELVLRRPHVGHALRVDASAVHNVALHVVRHDARVVHVHVVRERLDHRHVPRVEELCRPVPARRDQGRVLAVPRQAPRLVAVVRQAEALLLARLHVHDHHRPVLVAEVDRVVRRSPHRHLDPLGLLETRVRVVRALVVLDVVKVGDVVDADRRSLAHGLVRDARKMPAAVRPRNSPHRRLMPDRRQLLTRLHVPYPRRLVRSGRRQHAAARVHVARPHGTRVPVVRAETLSRHRVPHRRVQILRRGEEQVAVFVVFHHCDGTAVPVERERPHRLLLCVVMTNEVQIL
eukprot:Rhum_TRINITY_DN255_c0_g1::Rhum_TRINITY_DN255_c0_g1_i1::g.958::m.958